ncbi:24460_t:CDS:2 [Cetraspora pellucida]|uniref:24460_t:CDS:1 n=1 Tax=Cetraspora pellucida TaxID=1433469 RepID=A0A9N9E014_9GLOM|nr:24460_t:CDS:2 [Cetraspora pellucida]
MSEQIIEIPLHNGEKITKIVCSPKLKYVATWSDKDMSACIYSIKDQMNLEFEDYYPLKEKVEHGLSEEIKNVFLTAEKYDLKLSDQKHIVLMPYNEGRKYAEHRDHEVKILKPCDNKKEIIEGNFIVKENNKDNYFLLVRGKNDDDTKNLTGCVFELCGKRKKIFRISNYNSKDFIVLHNNGSIFIYKRDTHIIMARNIVTLDFISYLTTEWEIDCTHREFLFAVCEKNFCLLDPYIFTGEFISEYPYIFIDKETEEISKHPVFIDKKTLHHSYVINSGMIFYYENKLKIQDFPKAWRDKLNNMCSNLVAKEVLEEIEKDDESTKDQLYDKWMISKCDEKNISLSYNNIDKIKIAIPYTGIKRIKLLKNRDLLMNMVRNEHEDCLSEKIYIWTIKMQKIRLNYFWSNITLFKNEYEKYFPYLPSPEFEINAGICETDLNKHMIEDYVDSRSKLSLYGRYLMEYLLEKENFETIEKLLKNIINFTMKNNDGNFISNLSLMKMVTYNFHTLSQYPDIINWFLSRIAFFVPDNTLSEIINIDSTSSHLQQFGEYPNISDIYLIRLKIESFLNPVFTLLLLPFKLVKMSLECKQKKTTVKLVFPLMGLTNYPSKSDIFMSDDMILVEVLLRRLIYDLFQLGNPFVSSPNTNLYELWIDNIYMFKPGCKPNLLHFSVNTLAMGSLVSSAIKVASPNPHSGWLYEINNTYVAQLDEFRKVVRQIRNNTWPGFYKPYISPVLLEAIKMKSEPDQDD